MHNSQKKSNSHVHRLISSQKKAMRNPLISLKIQRMKKRSCLLTLSFYYIINHKDTQIQEDTNRTQESPIQEWVYRGDAQYEEI